MIRLILANFELVKCCLLYFSRVNDYNQMKAGSLFYFSGKNYRWPVKTVPLRWFFVRSLWRISHLIIQLLITAQLLLLPTIFLFGTFPPIFLRYRIEIDPIRSPKKVLQLSLSIDRFHHFNGFYHESRKLIHTVANVTSWLKNSCLDQWILFVTDFMQ